MKYTGKKPIACAISRPYFTADILTEMKCHLVDRFYVNTTPQVKQSERIQLSMQIFIKTKVADQEIKTKVFSRFFIKTNSNSFFSRQNETSLRVSLILSLMKIRHRSVLRVKIKKAAHRHQMLTMTSFEWVLIFYYLVFTVGFEFCLLKDC